MGRHDTIQHSQTETHMAIASARYQQSRLNVSDLCSSSQLAAKRTEVELKLAVLLASSNELPLS